jgi:hypothetical protein
MPGPALAVGAVILCPHGGTATIASHTVRVTAGCMPIAALGDRFAVAGCAHIVGSAPKPCVSIEWMTSATRVLIEGRPPILQTGAGLALDPALAPAGPPVIAVNQSRVIMV